MKLKYFLWLLLLLGGTLARGGEVQLGNEVLAQRGFREVLNKKIGLITNPSGVNQNLQSTAELLQSAKGVRLLAVFTPEPGLDADVLAADPMTNRMDSRSGLRIYSLFGKARKPTPEMLKGLDAVVYDVQDT